MFLGLALYAEGPTDHDFLGTLIFRLCEDLVHRYAEHNVSVSDVMSLNELARPRRRSTDRTGVHMPPGAYPERPITARDERVLFAARFAKGGWTVLLVHADGAGDAECARREQVQPALDLVQAAEDLPGTVCAVIPVREMESWVLADPEALGVPAGFVTLEEMPVPPARAAHVERIRDPKEALKRVVHARRAGRTGRVVDMGDMLKDLAQRMNLQRLRDVPSFRTFEAELDTCLRQLRILSP